MICKPLLEWLDSYPEPYRATCMELHRLYPCHRSVPDNLCFCASIHYAFIPEYTPQGAVFWRQLRDMMEAMCNLGLGVADINWPELPHAIWPINDTTLPSESRRYLEL